MSSESSDIEIHTTLPKKSTKKMPLSPSADILKKKHTSEKKLTTKIMINQALLDLKSRKGVSLYAIKKYITEKYNVETNKINFHIKKYIKSAVEEGTIVQTKGIGASGSFKLVPVKEKKPKPKKMAKEKTDNMKSLEKKKKLKEKSKTGAEKVKSNSDNSTNKPKEGKTEEKSTKAVKPKKFMEKKTKTIKEKGGKEKKDGDAKVKKVLIAKGMQTPGKKKNMGRRKSIGSIIKPAKMKPTARA